MLKNKYFINTIIGLSALFGIAASTGVDAVLPSFESCMSCFDNSKAYTYFKLGGGVLSANQGKELMPVIGVGRRIEWNGKAVDISANYAVAEKTGHYYSIPKIMYLQYLCPEADRSPYLAGGLSWGEQRDERKDKKFQGIFAELAIGYEFHRNSPIHTFVQLDISQGAIANHKRGSTPAPMIALSAGIGF